MESLGIWYQHNDNNEETSVDFHINLWNLYEKKKLKPFIDFGIVVNNFRSIDNISFLIPFHVEPKDIMDLFEYVKTPQVSRLIFNEEECEIESISQYYGIRINDDRKLLLSLDNDVLQTSIRKNETVLLFKFEEIRKNDKYTNYDKLYIRFRITSNEIANAMYCPVEKQNWFLESGFVKTQIVDIKVNKERNIPSDICQEMKRQNYSFAHFNKIHLLVMCNSNDVVDSFNNTHCECRKLEIEGWNDYLDNKFDIKNVIAYHWKETRESRELSDYGKLIKICSASTNYKLISIYMLVVVALGTIGSLLADIIMSIIGVFK